MDVAIAVYERFMLDVRIGRQGLFETQLTMDLIMNCTTMSESGKHQPLFWACQTFREITLVCVAACLSNRRVFARFSGKRRSVVLGPHCLRFGTPYVRPRARLSGARRRWPQLRPGDHAELATLARKALLSKSCHHVHQYVAATWKTPSMAKRGHIPQSLVQAFILETMVKRWKSMERDPRRGSLRKE